MKALFLLGSLSLLAHCSPQSTLEITVDNVPAKTARISVNVNQDGRSGVAIFQRNSANNYHFVPMTQMEMFSPLDSPNPVTVAVELPAGLDGPVAVGINLETDANMTMPMLTHQGCKPINIEEGQLNKLTVPVSVITVAAQCLP